MTIFKELLRGCLDPKEYTVRLIPWVREEVAENGPCLGGADHFITPVYSLGAGIDALLKD